MYEINWNFMSLKIVAGKCAEIVTTLHCMLIHYVPIYSHEKSAVSVLGVIFMDFFFSLSCEIAPILQFKRAIFTILLRRKGELKKHERKAHGISFYCIN